jgi:hypothetical protein
MKTKKKQNFHKTFRKSGETKKNKIFALRFTKLFLKVKKVEKFVL